MEVNVTKEGIKYGVILGLVGVFLMYGSWAMGLDAFIKVTSIGAFVPYIIITLIVAGLNLRKQNGNILPFKDAMKFTFLTYVIVAVITAIATYILYNIVDKELTQKSFEIGLEKTRTLMEKFGASEEQIDEALKKAEAEGQESGFKKIFLGTGLGLIWDFVKSLLITIIIRRENKVEFGGTDNF